MTQRPLPALAVHAGAGEWTVGAEDALQACAKALEVGMGLLEGGGSSLDAVVEAVRALESAPVCNAGTGAVLNANGELQLDASVMDGATLQSGAVGGLPPFEHPVDVARAVLTDGRYHLLCGSGAASFALANGFEPAEPEAMITDERRLEFDREVQVSGNTVGAVACDSLGHLASATSTGGIAGTAPGRIGDTPIVGAGTYANSVAACSCTGDGEAFARACAAFHAVDRARSGAQGAVESTIARVREQFDGYGGLILVDCEGEVAVGRTATKMPYGIARRGASIQLDL
jgi:L-asparaginase / beta-aspartyl-peptidase